MSDDTTTRGDTHREVTGSDDARVLLIRRTYDAAVEDVWDACTDPERISRWFRPVTGDLRPGGTFSIQHNASGEILRCEPPRLLRLSWMYGDQPASQVELRLATAASGAATVLELEHSAISRRVDVAGRAVDPILNDAATGIWGLGTGWELPLSFGLEQYLRGALPDRPAAEWFEVTDEVLGFADRTGAAWAAVVAEHAGGDRP
ncbi:MAG TPA: SRPBCC family protein [Solirubrobacteraceae bacterium]|nr:SRPBCC family protein [Solirubrobacteraceae bacterium]